MHFKFFSIPIQAPDNVTAELNRFLASHVILGIERHFVADGQNSLWAVCVSYQASGEVADNKAANKVDYKEVLDEKQFPVYLRLRDLRKTLADQEGVPAYALFNNKQLAEMVQNRVSSVTALKQIGGIGEARADKYGQAFVDVICSASELAVAQDDKPSA